MTHLKSIIMKERVYYHWKVFFFFFYCSSGRNFQCKWMLWSIDSKFTCKYKLPLVDVVKTALLYSWHLVPLLCFAVLTLLPMKFKLWCSKREIKVIQNIRFSQNREIQVLRNMCTSNSWNKHVAKISCNNVYMTTFTRSRVYSMENSCQFIAIHMMSWR